MCEAPSRRPLADIHDTSSTRKVSGLGREGVKEGNGDLPVDAACPQTASDACVPLLAPVRVLGWGPWLLLAVPRAPQRAEMGTLAPSGCPRSPSACWDRDSCGQAHRDIDLHAVAVTSGLVLEGHSIAAEGVIGDFQGVGEGVVIQEDPGGEFLRAESGHS